MSKQGKAERTKGEWKATDDADRTILCDTPVGKTLIVAETFGYPQETGISINEAIANAQFICKAVNAHEKLVEALTVIVAKRNDPRWDAECCAIVAEATLKSLTP